MATGFARRRVLRRAEIRVRAGIRLIIIRLADCSARLIRR
jgi:hypothetical protein